LPLLVSALDEVSVYVARVVEVMPPAGLDLRFYLVGRVPIVAVKSAETAADKLLQFVF